jgi:hypothetical protein
MEKNPGGSLIHLDAFSWFNPVSAPETLRRAVCDFDVGKINFVSCDEHRLNNGAFAMG